MNKRTYFLIFVAYLLLLACSDSIEITNQKWKYENRQCKITFTIKNNEHSGTSRKVKITAFRQRYIGDATVSDIIGEKTLYIDIKPNEVLDVEETIKLILNKKPTMVTVKHFEPK
jgi:hypothetical protein